MAKITVEKVFGKRKMLFKDCSAAAIEIIEKAGDGAKNEYVNCIR